MIARDVAPPAFAEASADKKRESWAFREHRSVVELDKETRLARLRAACARARDTMACSETTLLAWDWAARVRNDAGLGAWVEAALGLKPRADSALWRDLGIGVGRATVKRDGTWEPFADGDVPREVAGRGVPVLTIPVVPGGDLWAEYGEAIEIYAVELAPSVPARATGRVYALTGLALGLGVEGSVFHEWRSWSTGLAVVASPLDWVRAHRLVPERTTARAVPFLGDPAGDGMPCVWLADIVPGDDSRDFAAGDPDPDAWRAREIDRLLLESDPIVADGEATGLAIKARVASARKRAFPANPTIQIDVTEETEGEAA